MFYLFFSIGLQTELYKLLIKKKCLPKVNKLLKDLSILPTSLKRACSKLLQISWKISSVYKVYLFFKEWKRSKNAYRAFTLVKKRLCFKTEIKF